MSDYQVRKPGSRKGSRPASVDSSASELILVEKPEQAEAMVHYLAGKRLPKKPHYKIGSTIVVPLQGHALEFKEPDEIDKDKWGGPWYQCDYPILPAPIPVKINKMSKGRIETLKDLLRSFKGTVVIATDLDREGERIAQEALDHCRSRHPRVRMLVGTEVSAAAYEQVFHNRVPAEQKLPLAIASNTRAMIDYYWGMGPTRAATTSLKPRGVKGVLSEGRVQSVALALVVRREREIDDFVSRDFFEIRTYLKTEDGAELCLLYAPTVRETRDDRIYDKAIADEILRNAIGYDGQLSVDSSTKRRKPPLLFDINALQRTAAARWGWTADKTLEVADSVRLKGPITYCRGEDQYLPDNMAPTAAPLMQGLVKLDEFKAHGDHAASPQIRRDTVYNSKKLKGSHHAIIPSISYMEQCGGHFDLTCLNEEERQIFDLVATRFVANHLPDYEYEQTKISMNIPVASHGKTYEFAVIGNVPVKAGWKAVDDDDFAKNDKHIELPIVANGARAVVESGEICTKATKPPPPLNEHSLLALLKKLAIGTGATRHSIIKTLRDRKYIGGSAAKIKASNWGHGIVEANEHVPTIARCLVNPDYTAELEEALDKIASADSKHAAEQLADKLLDSVRQDVTEATSAMLEASALPSEIRVRFEADAAPTARKRSTRGKGGKTTRSNRSSQSKTNGNRFKPRGDRFERASQSRKPSQRQIEYASLLAKKKGVRLSSEVRGCSSACSAFIERHK